MTDTGASKAALEAALDFCDLPSDMPWSEVREALMPDTRNRVLAVASLLDRFAAEARARVVSEVRTILHEEGWIGRTEQRIADLAASPPPASYDDGGQADNKAVIKPKQRAASSTYRGPPSPSLYDAGYLAGKTDGVRDERARWEAALDPLKRSADPAHHYAAEYIRGQARGIAMERIEAGDAPPKSGVV